MKIESRKEVIGDSGCEGVVGLIRRFRVHVGVPIYILCNQIIAISQ